MFNEAQDSKITSANQLKNSSLANKYHEFIDEENPSANNQ